MTLSNEAVDKTFENRSVSQQKTADKAAILATQPKQPDKNHSVTTNSANLHNNVMMGMRDLTNNWFVQSLNFSSVPPSSRVSRARFLAQLCICLGRNIQDLYFSSEQLIFDAYPASLVDIWSFPQRISSRFHQCAPFLFNATQHHSTLSLNVANLTACDVNGGPRP